MPFIITVSPISAEGHFIVMLFSSKKILLESDTGWSKFSITLFET